jgi:hypothetical protein
MPKIVSTVATHSLLSAGNITAELAETFSTQNAQALYPESYLANQEEFAYASRAKE